MSVDRTLAIALRILRQISRDRRSLALIIVAPIVVMALVGFSFGDQQGVLDRIAPGLIAVFVLFFTFVLTGVSFLRERAQGTLERLLTTPVGRADILVGYTTGFFVLAMVQSVIVVTFTLLVLEVNYQGSIWQIWTVLVPLVVVGVSLGVFISTFARNEFQVVQFIPLLMAPQIFLSGVIAEVDKMPAAPGGACLPAAIDVRGRRAAGHHAARGLPGQPRPGAGRPCSICRRLTDRSGGGRTPILGRRRGLSSELRARP